jgi:hypothetical protein
VDPAASGAINYHEIVTRPMDFNTIREKLRADYTKPSEFFQDVQQVSYCWAMSTI